MGNSGNRREFIKTVGAMTVGLGALGRVPYDYGVSGGDGDLYDRNPSARNSRLKITNGRILTPYRTISSGSVLVEGGKILEVREGDIEFPGAVVINAQGRNIAPGFIDLHVHGGGGHDLLDATVDAYLGIAESHARHGTTAMYPTAGSGDLDELMRILDLYPEAVERNSRGAEMLGVFLEGPYYSMEQRGAQDPRFVRDPDPAEYRDVLSRTSAIKRWDSAPERNGSLEFAEYLISKGVIPSIGHTNAIYEEVLLAFEHGYRITTHIYSGMSGVTRRDAYRYAGAVEAAFLIDEMCVEVCSDNRHLPPSLLRLVYQTKGADKIALVTDSMRAAGMPDGEYVKGNLEAGRMVIVENGVAMLPDRTSFAGSVATADLLVRVMVEEAGVPLIDAVRMMSATPAAMMKIDDSKGTLVRGKDADIIVFDENIQIYTTIVNGKIVYEKS